MRSSFETRTGAETEARSRSRSAPLVVLLVACSASSPATEIREALARPAPITVGAAGARVSLRRADFRDVEVAVEGGRARVLAVVDADGTVSLPAGEVALGYVGREEFEMVRCARARWCASDSPLPALSAVVAALAAAPRDPARTAVAWQIRIDRDRAAVGEDATVPGGAAAPRRVIDLARDGTRWRLATPPPPGSE